jgi:hypothetical protein
VDPLAPEYPWNSTYAFAENAVIWGTDLEGTEQKIVIKSCGAITGTMEASDNTPEEWRLTSLQYLEMLRQSLNPQNNYYHWQLGKTEYFKELELQHQGGRISGNGAYATGVLTIDFCNQTGPNVYYSTANQQTKPKTTTTIEDMAFTINQANKLWFAPTEDKSILAFRSAANGYIGLIAAAFIPGNLTKTIVAEGTPFNIASITTDIVSGIDVLSTAACDGQDGLISGGIGSSGEAYTSIITGFLGLSGSYKLLKNTKSYEAILNVAFTTLAAAPSVISGSEKIYQDLFATTESNNEASGLTGIHAKVCTSSGNLNYRATPGLNGKALGKLPSNSSVKLTGLSNGLWVEAIVKPGQTAWVHSAYLRNE